MVVMRDMQGLDFEATRNERDLSASNVKALLHRGRLRLKMITYVQTTDSC